MIKIKIDNYITEKNNKIADEILFEVLDKKQKILLNSPMKTGKTTFTMNYLPSILMPSDIQEIFVTPIKSLMNDIKNKYPRTIKCNGNVSEIKLNNNVPILTTPESMHKVIKACEDENKRFFIVYDEIHQIISGGATENSNNSVAEILKPYLDVGKVRVIGATTTEDYMETVSSNPAFKTRFKRIDIKEPTNDTMYTILDNLIDTYNEVSGIVLDSDYTNRANIIKSLLDVTKKSCRDYKDPANNPRLVIDILKEAYAIAAINDRDEVTMDDIKLAISDEERIYKSARDRYSTIYGRETQKPKGIVLEFKPKKY